MVCLFIIFGAFAWLPVTYGDTSDNPHDGFNEVDLQKLHNTNHPMTWQQGEIDMMNKLLLTENHPLQHSQKHSYNNSGETHNNGEK